MGSKTHSSFQGCRASMCLHEVRGARASAEHNSSTLNLEHGNATKYSPQEKKHYQLLQGTGHAHFIQFYLFGKQEGFLSVRPFTYLDSTDCSEFDGDLATLENFSQYTSIKATACKSERECQSRVCALHSRYTKHCSSTRNARAGQSTVCFTQCNHFQRRNSRKATSIDFFFLILSSLQMRGGQKSNL